MGWRRFWSPGYHDLSVVKRAVKTELENWIWPGGQILISSTPCGPDEQVGSQSLDMAMMSDDGTFWRVLTIAGTSKHHAKSLAGCLEAPPASWLLVLQRAEQGSLQGARGLQRALLHIMQAPSRIAQLMSTSSLLLPVSWWAVRASLFYPSTNRSSI